MLRPHESLASLALHEPVGAFAVGAFADNQLVAVGFIAPGREAEGSWRVRGMATLARFRGQGAGGKVLRALLDHARANDATRVWCNARISAVALYARAGFSVVSERFEIPEIGPHVLMEWRVCARLAQSGPSTGASSSRRNGLKPTRS